VKLREHLIFNKEDRVRSQNENISDFCVKVLLFKGKIMFKTDSIKSNPRVLRKKNVDTYRAPVLHLIIASLFKVYLHVQFQSTILQ
jgi:hypothetical protein